MLLEFSVSNFKVFKERQTLSLLAKKSYKEFPETTANSDNFDDLLINKSAVIYGANGSGKSSLIEAIEFLEQYILFSFGNDSDVNDKIVDRRLPTFVFNNNNDGINEPTIFDITYLNDQDEKVIYHLSLDHERILEEGLWVYARKGVRAKTIISRSYNEQENSFEYYNPGLDIDKRTLEIVMDVISRNQRVPMITVLSAYKFKQAELVTGWFRKNLDIVSSRVDASFRATFKSHFLKYICEGDNEIKDEIISFMREFDFSITDIIVKKTDYDFESSELPDQLRNLMFAQFGYAILFEHTTSAGIKKYIDYDSLSAGTKRIFDISGYLIHFFQSDNKTLVFDEFENSLHPHLVKAIYDKIVKRSDKRHQMILTTHSPLLLDTTEIVRRDQIWFLDKNSDLETKLYPLTDFAPKKEDLILKGWQLGRFGGVPFLECEKCLNTKKDS